MSLLAIHLAAALVLSQLVVEFILLPCREPGERPAPRPAAARALTYAALAYALGGAWDLWWLPLAAAAAWLALDLLLSRRTASLGGLALDQAARLAAGLALATVASTLAPGASSLWLALFGARAAGALLALAAALAAVWGGSVFVGRAVEPFLAEVEAEGPVPQGAARRRRRGFAEGGRVIGMLERALIVLLVYVGQPAGVGFLVAAKSILRFGDVGPAADRREVEYILIGTLASFLFGLACAYAGLLAWRLLG